jgi:hypothetical protein
LAVSVYSFLSNNARCRAQFQNGTFAALPS